MPASISDTNCAVVLMVTWNKWKSRHNSECTVGTQGGHPGSHFRPGCQSGRSFSNPVVISSSSSLSWTVCFHKNFSIPKIVSGVCWTLTLSEHMDSKYPYERSVSSKKCIHSMQGFEGYLCDPTPQGTCHRQNPGTTLGLRCR